jgi:hypothetical protein
MLILKHFKVLLGAQVVRTGTCAADLVEAQASEPGEVAQEITAEELDALRAPPPPPPVTVESLRAALTARLAERRWEVEIAGTVFAGVPLATDDRSKLLITGAATRARADAGFVTRWKTPAGWVDLDAPTILAAYDAIFAHVNSCFAREAEHVAAITAAETIEELEALRPAIEIFNA